MNCRISDFEFQFKRAKAILYACACGARWLFVLGGLFLVVASGAQAQQINVDLYHAQNEGVRDDVKTEHPLRKGFDRLIGYRFYEKLGSATSKLESSYDQWLLPSKMFFLRFHRAAPEDKEVTLELFKKKKSIFQGKFIPKKERPLIITGPQYGNGLLVLVLRCKEGNELR